jgi:uncharacterized protein (DUF1684 family)
MRFQARAEAKQTAWQAKTANDMQEFIQNAGHFSLIC